MHNLPLTKTMNRMSVRILIFITSYGYAAWCLRLRSWVCVTWNSTLVNLRHNSTTNVTVMCRWHLPCSVVAMIQCVWASINVIKFHSCDKLPKENSKLCIILWYVRRKYTKTSEDTEISVLFLFVASCLVLSEMQFATCGCLAFWTWAF